MQTLIHADIFFVISSIGFILLFALAIVASVSVIGILRSVRRISAKLETDVETIGADTKEFFADVRESVVYRMLFRTSRRARK